MQNVWCDRQMTAAAHQAMRAQLAILTLELGLDLVEVLPFGVLGRHFTDRKRPRQPEPRIGVVQTALHAWRVELSHLIACLGRVLEDLVAVREALGHVERPVVVRAELDGDVLEIRRTLGAQIDDDVEDRASRAPDELGLGGRRILEVHAPQRSLGLVESDVGLRDDRLQSVIGKLLLAERASEEAAIVLATFDVDDEGAL